MKLRSPGIVIFVIVVFGGSLCASQSINDTETLLTNLLAGYNLDIRPATDQSQAVDVNIQLHLKFIKEFNDVLETFSFAGAVILQWHDPRLTWIPANYNGLDNIVMSYEKIWVPELILSSAATTRNTVTQSWNKVRIWANGWVSLLSANLIESTCSVNVRFYPFDTQECEIAFFSLGYLKTELNLNAPQDPDYSLTKSNAVWKIVGSDRYRSFLSSGETEVYFVVKLERKSSYTVLNVLLPVLFLSLLNTLVFLLIPESGERIGYCITTLLAIAVYMTIVADILPTSSDPVPIISYKLVTDLVCSVLIVLVVIINMRVANKPDKYPIPGCHKSLHRVLSCACCRRSTVNPEGHKRDKSAGSVTTVSEILIADTPFERKHNLDHDKADDTDNVTWKDISTVLDWIALVVFALASIASFVIFLGLILFKLQNVHAYVHQT